VSLSLQEQIDYLVASTLLEVRSGFNLRKFKTMTFKGQWKYANKHLKQLGMGSSRTAFLTSNRFVLKLALPGPNLMKGVGQNEAELDLFTNPKMKPVVAKIFDYDDVNHRVQWLVVELVRPLKARELEDKIGTKLEIAEAAWELFLGADNNLEWAQEQAEANIDRAADELDRLDVTQDRDSSSIEHYNDMMEKAELVLKSMSNPFVRLVMELVDEFGLILGDVGVVGHWGKTADGRVVLLDYGFTKEVLDRYYQ